MMKVRILDRCEFYEENQISSRFNQKKIQFEWIFEVSAAGLEPATNGLKGHCSTIELRARLRRILSRAGRGVNGT